MLVDAEPLSLEFSIQKRASAVYFHFYNLHCFAVHARLML
jgi:hypothetical protein